MPQSTLKAFSQARRPYGVTGINGVNWIKSFPQSSRRGAAFLCDPRPRAWWIGRRYKHEVCDPAYGRVAIHPTSPDWARYSLVKARAPNARPERWALAFGGERVERASNSGSTTHPPYSSEGAEVLGLLARSTRSGHTYHFRNSELDPPPWAATQPSANALRLRKRIGTDPTRSGRAGHPTVATVGCSLATLARNPYSLWCVTPSAIANRLTRTGFGSTVRVRKKVIVPIATIGCRRSGGGMGPVTSRASESRAARRWSVGPQRSRPQKRSPRAPVGAGPGQC